MKVSSKLPLFDLRKLNAALPVPSPGKGKVKLLILGASDDFIVVSYLVCIELLFVSVSFPILFH